MSAGGPDDPRHRAGSREGDLPPACPARRPRTATLWRDGDFLRLWFGESVSLAGTQVTLLALPLTAVVLFGAGAEQLGLLRTLQFIPFLVLALPFGMFVDRRRRRPIMIWANVARAIAIGLIPLLATLHQLHMPTGERRRLGAELFEGLRLVMSNPYLRMVTVAGAVFNFVHTFVADQPRGRTFT